MAQRGMHGIPAYDRQGARCARIWTVGHGDRALEAFLELLARADIECVVDVRAFPGSRRHPQFGRAALQKALGAAGIGYVWEGKALGGRRRPAAASPHVALTDDGFRAYADHMDSPGFREALDRLAARAGAERCALLCAERLPSQCHRALISDSLTARSVHVQHLIDSHTIQSHVMSALAREQDGRLIYDVGTQQSMEL